MIDRFCKFRKAAIVCSVAIVSCAFNCWAQGAGGAMPTPIPNFVGNSPVPVYRNDDPTKPVIFYKYENVPYGQGLKDASDSTGSASTKASEQKFDLYLPSDYDTRTNIPIVAYFHGGGLNSDSKDLPMASFDDVGSLMLIGCRNPSSAGTKFNCTNPLIPAYDGLLRRSGSSANSVIVASFNYGFYDQFRKNSAGVWTKNIYDHDTALNHRSVMENDALLAIEALRNNAPLFKGDPDRIITWGYSSGGLLATLTALTDGTGVRCIVNEQGQLGANPLDELVTNSPDAREVRTGGALDTCTDPADYKKAHAIFGMDKIGDGTSQSHLFYTDLDNNGFLCPIVSSGVTRWEAQVMNTPSLKRSYLGMSVNVRSNQTTLTAQGVDPSLLLNPTGRKMFSVHKTSFFDGEQSKHRHEVSTLMFRGERQEETCDIKGGSASLCSNSPYNFLCTTPSNSLQGQGLVLEERFGELCTGTSECSCYDGIPDNDSTDGVDSVQNCRNPITTSTVANEGYVWGANAFNAAVQFVRTNAFDSAGPCKW